LQTADVENVDQITIDRVSRELDSAFSTVGFVYLKNHGVNQQLVSCQDPVDVKTLKCVTDICCYRSIIYFNVPNRSSIFQIQSKKLIAVALIIATVTPEEMEKCQLFIFQINVLTI
jgi:hypothetical protein